MASVKAARAKMAEQEKKWETEEDLRTLRRAEEILKDPDRMKRVQAMVKKEVEALNKVGNAKGLRAMMSK